MELSLTINVAPAELAQSLNQHDAAYLIKEINWAQGRGEFSLEMALYFVEKVLECELGDDDTAYSDKLRELLK